MCDIPFEIADSEKIARGIKTPYHIKKNNTLKAAAFKPAPERDDLSVMRFDYMGSDKCKAHSKNIFGDSYVGLAVLSASEIRGKGASVEDSRDENFCGHADISQGMPAPKRGETAAPALAERYKSLADAARLYLDPEPNEEFWTGETIE